MALAANAGAHAAAQIPPAPDPNGASFPGRILVATDGSQAAGEAVGLAGRLARRHGARLDLLSVDPGAHGHPSEIAAQSVRLRAELGVDPTVVRTS
jgi:nucleotide-binding universal stress UspA family protein